MSSHVKLRGKTIRVPTKLDLDSPEALSLKKPVTKDKREKYISLILEVLSGEGSEIETEMKSAVNVLPDNFLFEPQSSTPVIQTCDISTDDKTNLYRCVSYIVFGTEKFWFVIRSAVIQTMENDSKLFDRICMKCGEGNVEEFTEKVFEDRYEQPNLKLELLGIAHFFQVAIYLFEEEGINKGKRPNIVLPPNNAEEGYIGISVHAFYLLEHKNKACFQPFHRNMNRFFIGKSKRPKLNETEQSTESSMKNTQKVQHISKPGPLDFHSFTCQTLLEMIDEESRKQCVSNIIDILGLDQTAMSENLRADSTTLLKNYIDGESGNVSEILVDDISTVDNSTLYRSVSFILFCGEKFWQIIRSAVITYMMRHETFFSKVCKESKIKEYCERIMRDKHSIPNLNLELPALAQLLHVVIFIFNKTGLQKGEEPRTIIPFGRKRDDKPAKRAIYLLEDQLEGKHYFKPFIRFNNIFYFDNDLSDSENQVKRTTPPTIQKGISYIEVKSSPNVSSSLIEPKKQPPNDEVSRKDHDGLMSDNLYKLKEGFKRLKEKVGESEWKLLTSDKSGDEPCKIKPKKRNLKTKLPSDLSDDDDSPIIKKPLLFEESEHSKIQKDNQERNKMYRTWDSELERPSFLSKRLSGKLASMKGSKKYETKDKALIKKSKYKFEETPISQTHSSKAFIKDELPDLSDNETNIQTKNLKTKRPLYLIDNNESPAIKKTLLHDENEIEVFEIEKYDPSAPQMFIDPDLELKSPTILTNNHKKKILLSKQKSKPSVKKTETRKPKYKYEETPISLAHSSKTFIEEELPDLSDKEIEIQSKNLKTKRPSHLNDNNESPTIKKTLLHDENVIDLTEIEQYDPSKPQMFIDSDSEPESSAILTSNHRQKIPQRKRLTTKLNERQKPKLLVQLPKALLGDALDLFDNEPSDTTNSISLHSPAISIRDFINENDRKKIVGIIWDGEKELIKTCSLPEVNCESEVFETMPIEDDGNSFYKSISYLVFGRQEYHVVFRRRLCEFMSDVMNEYTLNKVCQIQNSFTSFIRTYMQVVEPNRSGSPASNVEVAATALMLNIPVYVFEKDVNLQPELYLPDTDDIPHRGLILYRVQTTHYQPVVKYHRFFKKHKRENADFLQISNLDDNYNSNKKEVHWEKLNNKDSYVNSEDEFDTKNETKQRQSTFVNLTWSDDEECTMLNNVPVTSSLGIKEGKIKNSARKQLSREEQSLKSETRFKHFSDDLIPSMKKTFSGGEDASLAGDVHDLHSGDDSSKLSYTFDQRWNSNSDNYTIRVSGGSSLRQQFDYAVNAVFKKIESVTKSVELDNDAQTFDTKDFLRQRNYAKIVEMFNRQYRSNPIPERLFAHFKRVTRNTQTSVLFNVQSTNDRVIEHKRNVIDMRMRLQPFESRFNERYEGQVVSGKLKFACFAIVDNEEASENDFGYFHTGGKDGSWTPIPINQKVFEIQKHLKPGKSLIVNDTIFYLANDKLNTICLFCHYAPLKQLQIPETGTAVEELILARLSYDQLCIFDKVNSQFALCDELSVQNWKRFKKGNIRKLQRTHSQQFEFSTKEFPNRSLIIPDEPNQTQIVVSDLFTGQDARIPSRHEYVIKREGVMKFNSEIKVIQPGFVQVNIKAFETNNDAKYLLICEEYLRETISQIKDKFDN